MGRTERRAVRRISRRGVHRRRGPARADRAQLWGTPQIVLKVQAPTAEEIASLRPGTVVIALMNPSRNLDRIAKMRDAGITAFALELLPRITRSQSMDVLYVAGDGRGVPRRAPRGRLLTEIPADADDGGRRPSARRGCSCSAPGSPA